MKVLVLVHQDLIPPDKKPTKRQWARAPWKTEYDVINGLKDAGCDVQAVGVYDDLGVIEKAVSEFKPAVIFNLLEEFNGEAEFDQNVVSYLEMLGVPYTGSNPRGLVLARDKALAKTLVQSQGILTPEFVVFEYGKKVTLSQNTKFPCFVKTVNEEASLGIDQRSVVKSEGALINKIKRLHEKFKTDVLVEEYIDGREFYVGIVGNKNIKAFPVWELYLDGIPKNHPKIASCQVKWDFDYREKYGVVTGPAKNLSKEKESEIHNIARRVYKALGLSGYARIDLRMEKDGKVYFLEANPNPDIGYKEDLSSSVEYAGEEYPQLLERLLRLGINWSKNKAS